MLAQKNTTINSYRLSYLIQYRILKIPVRVKIKSVLSPETSLIFDNACTDIQRFEAYSDN